MARPARLERATSWTATRRSIHLSYGRNCPGLQSGETLANRFLRARLTKMFRTMVAEREGFEPSYGVTHNTLSKRAPSTARPSLRRIFCDRVRAYPTQKTTKNFDGGEGGIRTLDRGLAYTPLAGERLRPTRPPLHRRGRITFLVAEREGFEPSRRVNVCRFSRPVPSTTWLPLHKLDYSLAFYAFIPAYGAKPRIFRREKSGSSARKA